MERLSWQSLILWAHSVARRPPPEKVFNALLVLGGGGCPAEPFQSVSTRAVVSLPPQNTWNQGVTDNADANIRFPSLRCSADALKNHGRVLSQWARKESQRPIPLLRGSRILLLCDGGREYAHELQTEVLAPPRPPDGAGPGGGAAGLRAVRAAG